VRSLVQEADRELAALERYFTGSAEIAALGSMGSKSHGGPRERPRARFARIPAKLRPVFRIGQVAADSIGVACPRAERPSPSWSLIARFGRDATPIGYSNRRSAGMTCAPSKRRTRQTLTTAFARRSPAHSSAPL
jgi:hypothetical protein